MNYVLILLPPAEAHVDEAYRWYNQQRPGLGEEFILSLEASLASIQRSPLLYPKVRGETRRAVIKRFPYSVFYSVRGDRIGVAAVFHSSRNPRTWQERHPWRE
jgi:plasmid stabilization system protein ParE